MKIIGHRGAAGLALENTLPSLELARLLGVHAIEFDVRKTKDNRLVLCHDADLSDISNSDAKVRSLNYKKKKLFLEAQVLGRFRAQSPGEMRIQQHLNVLVSVDSGLPPRAADSKAAKPRREHATRLLKKRRTP